MATTARTWFYETPESDAYLLQERVNSTFWMHRLWNIYFVAESAAPPFRMSGEWNGQTLTIEWEPAQWFRLTAPETLPEFVRGISNVLMIPATLTYTNNNGQSVTEWLRQGADERWSAIQGNPQYQSPLRLDKRR